MRWTAEELAEMAKVDAALEAASMTPEEWKESIARDRSAARKADKVAEYQRAYREANKDKIAERRRQYYLRAGK